MATPEEARQELARRELARRELTRRQAAPSDQSHATPWSEVGRGTLEEIKGIGTGFVDEAKLLGSKVFNRKSVAAQEAAMEGKRGMGRDLGAFGADAAITAPIGGLAEMAVGKGAAAALPAAGKWLTRAGRVARAGTGGAVQGALLAPQGQEVGGAAGMGALSSALSMAGSAGRGAAGLLAKNRMSPEATTALKHLREVDTEALIPASHALKPGLLKSLYGGIVANVPTSGGILRDQLAAAEKAGMRSMVDDATPGITPIEHVFPKEGNLGKALEALDSKTPSGAWHKSLSKYNQIRFDTQGLHIPESIESHLGEYGLPPLGPQATGEQLTHYRDAIQRASEQVLKKTGGDKILSAKLLQPYEKARDDILATMRRRYTKSDGSVANHFKQYEEDLGTFKNYSILNDAAQQTTAANPGFKAVAMESVRRDPHAGAMLKGGPMQEKGNLFGDVLEPFPSKQGVFQMGAATGASSGATGLLLKALGMAGTAANMAALGIPLAVAKKAASPEFQKALLEGGAKSKAAVKFIDDHPTLARALRQFTVANVGGEQ